MSEFKINLYYFSADAMGVADWTEVKGNALGVQALKDELGATSTEWFIDSTGAFFDSGGTTTETGTPSGAASWVDPAAYPSYHTVRRSNETASAFKIVGPASADFTVDCYSLGTNTVGAVWQLNSQTPQTVQQASNFTSVATFSGTLDVNGEALLSVISDSATVYSRANAIRITTAGAADTTAPAVSSSSVPAAGNAIAVQMSESMQVGAGGAGGWTISLGDATISAAAVDGTDDTIINLTPSRTLLSGETFTIGYTQPGDGFQDQASTPNDLATLSGQAVTNNSTQGTLSISAADNITSEGDTATFTLANNAAAPTGATLNGTDVGTLTLVSGSTYSYTAPLLPDDATADLVVSVDSTTVSAVISYANSYPYELVTHGTPDANSIFFDTQFGTTQPVEWGVVTDYNASIVTVDHAAMDAAEDELNDVDLHSTEVAEGTSTATYKYYVTETGATGTFQASITVAALDTTSPTISSVSVPTAGSYKAGDTLSFTVNFDEAVDVTGTPQLALDIGGTTRQADYASGTGTSALVLSYTVQAGENDAGGISVSSLGLNSGTIVDQATSPNSANLTLNSIGSTANVLVDTTRPVINPIGANPANVVVGGTYTDAGATATDSQDGSLGAVTGTGTVDTNTIGQYTITYQGAGVVDSAGNVALDATRTVNVVPVVFWPFGKGINPTATKTWEWGERHPKTGMRTRVYK